MRLYPGGRGRFPSEGEVPAAEPSILREDEDDRPFTPRPLKFPPGLFTLRDRLIAIFGVETFVAWSGIPPLVISDNWKKFDIQTIISTAGFGPFMHPSFTNDQFAAANAYADLDFVTPLRSDMKVPTAGRIFSTPAVSVTRIDDDKLELTFGHMALIHNEWKVTNLRAFIDREQGAASPAPVTYFKEER